MIFTYAIKTSVKSTLRDSRTIVRASDFLFILGGKIGGVIRSQGGSTVDLRVSLLFKDLNFPQSYFENFGLTFGWG